MTAEINKKLPSGAGHHKKKKKKLFSLFTCMAYYHGFGSILMDIIS